MSTISSRISEITLLTGGRIAVVPTNVKDVVTIAGSIIGGPAAFGKESSAAVSFAADLLDAGAGKLGKAAFRDALASRGAAISFTANGTRLSFTASCFPEDAKYVIDRIADALFSPHLPARELTGEKTRTLTALAEEAGDTRAQAGRAAARLIYEPNHPGYALTLDAERRQTESATLAGVKKIAAAYGTKHLALAVVGDVNTSTLLPAIEKAFGRAEAGQARPSAAPLKSVTSRRENVIVPDKATADVIMGAATGFNTDDTRYLPAMLAVHALGSGSFASHLMQTVRERDGLTYGVQAKLRGFEDKLDGAFLVWATFAPELLLRGIDMLSKETALFLKSGVTEERFTGVKTEIAGSYAVSLSTTAGLAARIVRFMEDDRPLSRVDEYPELVGRVTLKEAQDAAAYLASLPLSIATAGSF